MNCTATFNFPSKTYETNHGYRKKENYFIYNTVKSKITKNYLIHRKKKKKSLCHKPGSDSA